MHKLGKIGIFFEYFRGFTGSQEANFKYFYNPVF